MPSDLIISTQQLFSEGTQNIPIRNTFVHFEEERGSAFDALFSAESAMRSAPPEMLNETFQTKWPQHEAKHFKNECRPCAYYLKKADSCRRGGDCDFCHLCPESAMKARKKEKIQRLRQQQLAQKLVEGNPKLGFSRITPSTSGSTTPSSGGDTSSFGSPGSPVREPPNSSCALQPGQGRDVGFVGSPDHMPAHCQYSWADIYDAEWQRPWLGSAF